LHTIDVKVEGKRMHIKNCWKTVWGGNGVRESIWKDLTDQSKAHPQWAYIETPFKYQLKY
jgi:hypothetical protein